MKFVGLFAGNISGNSINSNLADNYSYIYREYAYQDISFKAVHLNKFLNDKCFFENDEIICASDGVILNSRELYGGSPGGLENYIVDEIKAGNPQFWKQFNGTFSGIMYNKIEKKWILYVNQIGDRGLFYYSEAGKTIICTEILPIIETMKNNKINFEVNEEACLEVAVYGYLLDDDTLINRIKRVRAGTYVVIDELTGTVSVERYHEFSNLEPRNESIEDYIDNIDLKFRHAVQLEFEKDREYGYNHIANLSGGLDSRMTVWVARELGFDNITTMCFSQSKYADQTISQEVANYLRCSHLFKSLDDARFLMDIQDIVAHSSAVVGVGGISHTYHLNALIDMSGFGLLHSGQLGGAVLGTYNSTSEHVLPNPFSGANGKIMEELQFKDYSSLYPNNEDYMMKTRGLQGILSSHLYHDHYTEVIAPFCDVDFFEYCYSIPVGLRIDRSLYRKWIIKKYPKAADFIWEKYNCKITDSDMVISIKRRLKKYHRRHNPEWNMNPFNYWYKQYDDLKEFAQTELDSKIMNSKISEDLRRKLQVFFASGKARDKWQVLTVLTFIDMCAQL